MRFRTRGEEPLTRSSRFHGLSRSARNRRILRTYEITGNNRRRNNIMRSGISIHLPRWTWIAITVSTIFTTRVYKEEVLGGEDSFFFFWLSSSFFLLPSTKGSCQRRKEREKEKMAFPGNPWGQSSIRKHRNRTLIIAKYVRKWIYIIDGITFSDIWFSTRFLE